jgi:hypothetical protein
VTNVFADLEQHLVQTEMDIHSAAGEVIDVYESGGDLPSAIERLKAAFDEKADAVSAIQFLHRIAPTTEGTSWR